MKIVNITGGLGNQMFQYALYLALLRKYPKEKIKICTKSYAGYGLHNNYELNTVFGVEAEEATIVDLLYYAYPIFNYKSWQICHHLMPVRKSMFKEKVFGRYYSEVFDISGNCFYDGYWQSEKYFADIRNTILQIFTPCNLDTRNRDFAERIGASRSVSIHVRRGDFINNPIYKGICDEDYYRKAIQRILSETDVDEFCVFSNNMEWCAEHIIPLLNGHKCTMIDWNTGKDSHKDLYLMSRCRHNIIAHSSFSWWGAWLNTHQDKIVIGPTHWVNIKGNEFVLPNNWIRI